MTHRAYRNQGGEPDLSLYGRRDTVPSVPIKGDCVGCGEETTRAVSTRTGHYWQCKACGELVLRSLYERAIRKIG